MSEDFLKKQKKGLEIERKRSFLYIFYSFNLLSSFIIDTYTLRVIYILICLFFIYITLQ